MRRYESLRASDADRDAVTDRLREAAGEGRLEPEELEERVDAALRARTYGELTRLVADLPRKSTTPWRPGRRRKALARSALLGAGLLAAVAAAAVVVAVVVVLAVAAAALTAACWIGCVVFWLVCRARRRVGPASLRRQATPPRPAHRPRATGLL
jgi:Flp pilus assembly protein TadB